MFSMRFARPLAASVLALVLLAPAWAAPKQKIATHTVQHPPARKATMPGTNPHSNMRTHPVGAPNTHKHHKWL